MNSTVMKKGVGDREHRYRKCRDMTNVYPVSAASMARMNRQGQK